MSGPKITAHTLDNISNEISSRSLLPILIRKLIAENNNGIKSMSFPANTDMHGVDGELNTDIASLNVQKGCSYWEFSVSENIIGKANSDIKNRDDMIDKDIAFNFVTLRIWNKKNDWIEKNQDKGWREVCAYDANDIEEWLAKSIHTSIWLSAELERSQNYLEIPENFLKNWTTDKIPSDLLLNNRENEVDKFVKFLNNDNRGKKFSIMADTRDEAVAFASRVIIDNKLHAIILEDKESINEILKCSIDHKTYILIARTSDIAENMKLRKLCKNHILIVADFDKTNPLSNDNFIILPRVKSYDDLTYDNYSLAKKRQLYNKTNGSLSTLSRTLNDEKHKWGEKYKTDINFMWLNLVGGWDGYHPRDKELILSLIPSNDILVWDKFIQNLSVEEDSPLSKTSDNWKCYKLHSRDYGYNIIDKGVRDNADEIRRFLKETLCVFKEKDNRVIKITGDQYSETLRKGMAFGILLLKKSDRFNLDISYFYNDLFEDKTAWHNCRDILSILAEASPDDFINKVQELIDYKDKFYFNIEILWAIELIVRDNSRLKRVIELLCKLDIKYKDDLDIKYRDNKSFIQSMRNILIFPNQPFTSANTEDRIIIMKELYKKYPLQITKLYLDYSDRTSCDRTLLSEDWMDGEPVETDGKLVAEAYVEFINTFLRGNHPLKDRFEIATKCVLNMQYLGYNFFNAIRASILALPNIDDDLMINLYEAARVKLIIFKSKEYSIEFLEEIYERFVPKDIVKRKAYLFAHHRPIIEKDEDLSDTNHWNKTKEMRSDALDEIFEDQEKDGIRKIVNSTDHPNLIFDWLDNKKGIDKKEFGLIDNPVNPDLNKLSIKEKLDLFEKHVKLYNRNPIWHNFKKFAFAVINMNMTYKTRSDIYEFGKSRRDTYFLEKSIEDDPAFFVYLIKNNIINGISVGPEVDVNFCSVNFSWSDGVNVDEKLLQDWVSIIDIITKKENTKDMKYINYVLNSLLFHSYHLANNSEYDKSVKNILEKRVDDKKSLIRQMAMGITNRIGFCKLDEDGNNKTVEDLVNYYREMYKNSGDVIFYEVYLSLENDVKNQINSYKERKMD